MNALVPWANWSVFLLVRVQSISVSSRVSTKPIPHLKPLHPSPLACDWRLDLGHRVVDLCQNCAGSSSQGLVQFKDVRQISFPNLGVLRFERKPWLAHAIPPF